MMIEEFQIFNNDTEVTIVQRIANTFDSLPRFILISGIYIRDKLIATTVDKKSLVDIKKHKSVRIDVWDGMSTTMSAAAKQGSKFSKFYTRDIAANIESKNILAEIVFIWCYSKIQQVGAIEETFMDLVVDQSVFSDITSTIPTINDIIDRNPLYNKLNIATIKNYFISLKAQLQKNAEAVQRIVNANEIQKSIKGVPTTEFEREQNKIRWITNLKGISIFEMFDSLVLSSKAPFASVDRFYKILKNFRVNRDWVETAKDKLVIKFFSTPTADPVDILFYVEDDFINITSTVDVGKHEKPENEMMDFIKTLLPTVTFGITKTMIENIFGVFYIPQQKLDFYVFAHLVMNDKQFSNFFIDESDKATKTKSGVYTYYDVGGNDLVPLIITAKTVFKYDPTIRDKLTAGFPEGSPYIRIKISNAKTMENIEQIMSSLSKSMTLYNKLYEKVVALYKKFIPSFANVTVVKAVGEGKKIKFKDIDPDLFSGQYSRDCQHRPDIIDESEVQSYGNTMMFPKTAEEGTQRHYTCENRTDNYKFVGLQYKKSGKPTYRYVPCCFVENQEEKLGSTHNEYFKGAEYSKQKGPQQRLVEGGKFLNYDTYGTFDDFPVLKKLFVDIDDSYRYLRWGTDKSRYSFLQCVVEAVGYMGYNTASFETREKSINNIIKELVDDVNMLTVSKQALYDKSITDIRKILEKDEYINPAFFKDLFEIKFNCKIIVFNTQSIENIRSAKSYIPLQENNRPVVLIIQHLGSDPLKVPHPRCELIARTNRSQNRDVTFALPYDLPFIVKLSEIERLMTLSYIGKSIVTYGTIPKEIFDISMFQIVNSFGKTCGLVTREGFLFYIPTPCAPIPLPETTDYITRNAHDTLTFINERLGRNVKQIINYNLLVGFEVEVNGSIYCVPVESRGKLDTMEVSKQRIVFPRKEENSVLSKFLKLQKIARYLREYICFLFSKYLSENNILVISDEVIEKFISQKTTMSETVEYKIKSRFFNDNIENFLDKSGKLRIKNQELLKRLVFSLRVEIDQRSQEIFEYHNRTRAENFIIDYNDFAQYPNQVIVEGKDSIQKYLNERVSIYPVAHAIQPLSHKIYFFSNSIIGNSTYIAKNVYNIDEAFAYLYNKQRYNILSGEIPTDVNPRRIIDVDIYIFSPDGDITLSHKADTTNKLIIYQDGPDNELPAYTILFDFY
jgi:hypothetical protein